MRCAQIIASHLSTVQRDCLVEHAPGPQPFPVDTTRKTRQVLIDNELLCPYRTRDTSRPAQLRLTELGREVACVILGAEADALTEKQLLENTTVVPQKEPQPCEDHTTRFPAAATQEDTHVLTIIRNREATDKLLARLQGGP